MEPLLPRPRWAPTRLRDADGAGLGPPERPHQVKSALGVQSDGAALGRQGLALAPKFSASSPPATTARATVVTRRCRSAKVVGQ